MLDLSAGSGARELHPEVELEPEPELLMVRTNFSTCIFPSYLQLA